MTRQALCYLSHLWWLLRRGFFLAAFPALCSINTVAKSRLVVDKTAFRDFVRAKPRASAGRAAPLSRFLRKIFSQRYPEILASLLQFYKYTRKAGRRAPDVRLFRGPQIALGDVERTAGCVPRRSHQVECRPSFGSEDRDMVALNY